MERCLYTYNEQVGLGLHGFIHGPLLTNYIHQTQHVLIIRTSQSGQHDKSEPIADHVRQDSDRVAEVTAAIRCISFCDDKRQKRSSVRRETFETWPQTGMRCLEGHKAHISFLQDICPACVLMICAISPSNIAPRSLGMSLDVLSGVYSNEQVEINSGKQRTIICYNCKEEGHMSKQCTKPKRKRDDSWFKDKVLLVQAQVSCQILHVECIRFLADPGIPVGSDALSEKAQQLEPMIYVGDIIQKSNPIVIPDSEETLTLAEESHFETRFVPQTELSAEQAFWSHNSVNSSEPDLFYRPTNVEIPKELPKVNMVNTSLKKLKYICYFDVAVEQHRVESKTFEVKMNQALNENERLLVQVMSKEIVNLIVNSSMDFAFGWTKLFAENEHLKQTYKQLYDSIKPARVRSKEQCADLTNQVNLKSMEISDLNACLQEKVLVAHSAYIKRTQEEAAVFRDLVDHIQANYPLDPTLEFAYHVVAPKGTAHVQHSKLNANSELKCVKCNGCMLSDNHDLCVLDYINNRPTSRPFTIVGNACPLTRNTTTTEAPLRKQVVLDNETSKPAVTFFYSRKPRNSKTNVPVSKSKVVQIVLWYLDSGCSKHMTGDRSQLTNFVNKFLGTVKFGNDHVAKILGYGDYQIGESRYDIKGFTMWKDLDTTYSLLGSFVIQTLRLLFVNMPASLVI
ncbi:retrovirus-related pol polyprotein from transposon TNT 1-94 [Tanacetum coccineum]